MGKSVLAALQNKLPRQMTICPRPMCPRTKLLRSCLLYQTPLDDTSQNDALYFWDFYEYRDDQMLLRIHFRGQNVQVIALPFLKVQYGLQ
jgi:hypothetical protein